MHYQEIASITDINIRSLLKELRAHYPNEVTLYELKKDLIKVFEESEILKSLGISINYNKNRTKPKYSELGYRSEFIGLDLMIILEDRKNCYFAN